MTGRDGSDRRGLLALVVPAHAPAGHLVVRSSGRTVVEAWADEATERGLPRGGNTAYDLASVTKVFTALAFMRLVEAGAVALDEAVRGTLPAFGGRSPLADAVTWRHLLSHDAGLPAGTWLLDRPSAAAARERVLGVPPEHPPGTAVAYSDVGFMVLGFGIEALAGASLDAAVERLVIMPLGLRDTAYRPRERDSVAPTELCSWRGRRLRGEVHDESAAALGGVAGHAGLFSTARDLARLGDVLLAGGAPLLRPGTLAEMVRVQAEQGAIRRGLGFALWSADPEATSHPLGPRSFGHTGFTGTSLWIDPCRSLVVVLLTNAVYRGRGGLDAFAAARLDVHRALAQELPCEDLEAT